MSKLLLVDDDQEFTSMLSEFLSSDGFEVSIANNGEEALDMLQKTAYSICVLDIMMPKKNGIETLKSIRLTSQIPVLMLTAKAEPIDKILGLELGADDYLAKPAEPRELLARLKSILRRSQGTLAPEVLRDILWDDQKRVITIQERILELTGIEYEVLKILAQNIGQVVGKDFLSKNALKRPLFPFDRSLDVHISNIRKKIEGLDASIKSVRGRGYQLIV
ncbi:two-component regulatory system response regulator CpxR [Gammaproteobacteria bacterium]|nr:two-component regulatory system response regulator CpxR [Gammaproteobacteria bacterium]